MALSEWLRQAWRRQRRPGWRGWAWGFAVTIFTVVLILFADASGIVADLTSRQRHRLDATTRALLDVLPADRGKLEVYGVVSDRAVDRVAAEQGLDPLLANVAAHSPRVRARLIAFSTEPELCRELGTGRTPTLALRWSEPVSDGLQLVADIEPTPAGLRRALRTLLETKRPPVLLLSGHGELAVSGSGGEPGPLLLFAHHLDDEAGFAVGPGTLVARGGALPPDAVVVSAGPRADFLVEELDQLDTHLRSGGGALLLLGPVLGTGGRQRPLPLLEQWLDSRGVSLQADVVADLDGLSRGDVRHLVLTPTVDVHPAGPPPGLLLTLPIARSLVGNEALAAATRAQALFETRRSSWSERDDLAAPTFDLDRDATGPLELARALHVGDGRLVVIGSHELARNERFLQGGNSAFLTRAVRWLAGGDAEATGAGDTTEADTPARDGTLVLDGGRRAPFRWTLMLAVILPLALAGWTAWRRR
ncbi:MAG: hypothetical protein AAF533_24135 [Acidobacteriota bacterium]